MDKILELLMSTNGIILLGIIWYLVQYFLGVKNGSKEKTEKWLMSQFVAGIAEQEANKDNINLPKGKDKNKTAINNILRENVIDSVMRVAKSKDKKKSLKKIGIELSRKAAGIAIDRIIKGSKMGIVLKLRDLPFLKKLL